MSPKMASETTWSTGFQASTIKFLHVLTPLGNMWIIGQPETKKKTKVK